MQSQIVSLKQQAFTLLELLLVVLIMGIAYAALFNTALLRLNPKGQEKFSVNTPLAFFKTLPGYGQSRFELYLPEKGAPLLLKDGEPVPFQGSLPRAKMYTLLPDGSLIPQNPGPIRLNGREIRPLYRLVCTREGYMEPAILQTDKGWLYIHPFRSTRHLPNSAELINSVQAEEYLPDKAGYAQ